MDTCKKAEQVKEQIMKELFSDISTNECVLDVYLTEKQIKRISANVELGGESTEFVESALQRLLIEHNKGNHLFFRKYGYEKILNDYLEDRYGVKSLNFSMFQNENPVNNPNIIEENAILDKKQDITKAVRAFRWEKIIELKDIRYETISNSGEKIKVIYGKKNQKIINAKELCNYNGDLIGENYDIEKLVQEIEKTHPQIKNNIIVVTNKNNKNCKDKKKNEKNMHRLLLQLNEQCIVQLTEKYSISLKEIKSIIKAYNGKCRYFMSKNLCKLKNQECTLFYSDCINHIKFLNEVEARANKNKLIKEQEALYYDISKVYNMNVQSVRNIAREFQNKCKYNQNYMCSQENEKGEVCSLQKKKCIWHNKFLASIQTKSTNNATEKKKESELKVAKKTVENNSRTEIGLKDFVVKSNVFRCMHRKHEIQNIEAIIKINDNKGIEQKVRVSAGYCPYCKVYFIMDSTYQKLKKKGIILCRVSDEKNYMKGGYVGGMHLANESILMQYGYSVSQTEGLSATNRRKILAVIIDNKILSKSEIISYLDFFINQRSSLWNMTNAISKWEADREFVENYKIGQFMQHGVKAIYRN